MPSPHLTEWKWRLSRRPKAPGTWLGSTEGDPALVPLPSGVHRRSGFLASHRRTTGCSGHPHVHLHGRTSRPQAEAEAVAGSKMTATNCTAEPARAGGPGGNPALRPAPRLGFHVRKTQQARGILPSAPSWVSQHSTWPLSLVPPVDRGNSPQEPQSAMAWCQLLLGHSVVPSWLLSPPPEHPPCSGLEATMAGAFSRLLL